MITNYKQFIEQNIELIEIDSWEEIYKKASKNLKPIDVGNFTSCLLEADIHPEKYLTKLPDYFLYGSKIDNFKIPSHITEIGSYAFCDCGNFTRTDITDIETWCNISFNNTYANPLKYAHNLYLNGNLVTNLILPNSVTSINDHVFEECLSLEHITIPDNVTSIGYSAFCNCMNLTSMILPNMIASIGKYAFYGCEKLNNITLPNSIRTIEYCAFSECHNLTNIYYNGTREEWKRIYTKNAFKHIYYTIDCIDGKITNKRR